MSNSGDDTFHEDAIFIAKDLRKAFDKIELITGRTLIESVIHGLNVIYGISLEYGSDDSVYSLAQFRRALEDMLGRDVADLIMRKVKKELFDQLHAEINNNKQ